MKYQHYDKLKQYAADGLLEVNKHPTEDLYIYNYSRKTQYESLWDDVTIQCRGLILDGKGEIVAKAFDKFFNIEEEKDLSWECEHVWVQEKMDGCCHEDTILITENGEKTIREICESEYKGKVLSFDVNNEEYEYKDILTSSIMDDNDDWYEIELENGKNIKLTGNHKVWLPELKCYRKVEDLQGDEVFLLM